ncbi:raffinose/stachyose/melibiose transport system substrate-binding protein [Paenibacillus forsythiae]|uniref:Raffinose/stachyose/melibiose transport system substrate-binding protein n=1 Tax=Paenibacillus forsythiae TaxID=365616 RepID=A0ABU3HC53_9BACL|nr:extracellular solute-binding protein [Paenibacillus forsythiae]MDT3428399.1 raffinose/stachyose/melibiose transport system substrate-binding protein [Paenibacillus forsythiae]
MKRSFIISCVLVLMCCLLAACGANSNSGANTGNDAAGTGGSNAQKEVTIKLYQQKVEIAEQLKVLKAEYEKTHPGVKIEIESVLSSQYGTKLKAKLAANEMPDIFNNGGYSDMDVWADHLEDLTDQPWVSDAVDSAKAPMMKDGKLYGFPLSLEGSGLVYNKDMFAKAGITELPKTLSELEEASKKLKAQGYTPFVNDYASVWDLGITIFDSFMAKVPDTDKFIADLNSGAATFAGNDVFKGLPKYLDIAMKNGNPNPLTTDYNTSMTMFATGQGAMIPAGNWIQPLVDKINPNIQAGLMPMPVSDDADFNKNAVFTSPTVWVVNKNSPVKEQAKEFLNWLVTSDIGKQYVAKEFKLVPAFKSIKADPADVGSIGADLTKFSEEGNSLPMQASKMPEGLYTEIAQSMQKYVAGKSTPDQMLAEFQASWNKLKK